MTKHHVPGWEQERVIQFASDFGATLGLARYVWTIGIDPPDDDGAWASILVTQQRWHVTIWLCKDWMKLRERDRCRSIAHEVIHVTHRDIDHLVEVIRPEINPGPRAAEDAWQAMFRYEVEKMVDAMALAWYEATTLQKHWDELGDKHRPKSKRKKGKD